MFNYCSRKKKNGRNFQRLDSGGLDVIKRILSFFVFCFQQGLATLRFWSHKRIYFVITRCCDLNCRFFCWLLLFCSCLFFLYLWTFCAGGGAKATRRKALLFQQKHEKQSSNNLFKRDNREKVKKVYWKILQRQTSVTLFSLWTKFWFSQERCARAKWWNT